MSEELNEKEFEIATKLIDLGLSKAAGALESILRSPISIKALDFSISNNTDTSSYITKNNDNVHLLKTVLIGDLKGICHLIFSQEEVSKVYSACLPESIVQSNSEQNDMMKKEFLTEIDNIVSAAAITQFANFLELNVYGGIPALHVMNSDSAKEYIHTESGDLGYIIKFKAHFHASELDIYPDFIWLLDNDFIKKIKAFSLGSKVNEL